MTSTVDVLVVGSGASAVQAAWPLVQAGLSVRMLDFGNRDEVYADLVPPGRFDQLRRTDPQQHRYFLGDRFEGIAFGLTGAGAQLTPPRLFVARDTEAATPVDSAGFFPLQSLARGGLASAWGAGCPPFAASDLEGLPLSAEELAPHYDAVARRIGVSGAHDDLLPFFGELPSLLPATDLDDNARSISERYGHQRERLQQRGFHLGRPRLALLSREQHGRGPTSYSDMDFWTDRDRAVYRPRYTLDELLEQDGFDYHPGLLVESFAEGAPDTVEVRARRAADGERVTYRARRLVLAAGTLGTLRIVARSLERYGHEFPLVCNPHTYLPLLNLAMVGRPAETPRHSLAQLCFVHAPRGAAGPTTVGHVYSYRSLLLFRLLRDSPLAAPESLGLFRALLSALTVVVVQHPDQPGPAKRCSLHGAGANAADRLHIRYAGTAEQRRLADQAEREILRAFRALGCIGLRRVRPGHGASVHYAGTLPMSERELELTTTVAGRLRGTRTVHVVDGSVFPHLPSRGLTFTMMANAHRVGRHLADALRA